MKVIFRTVEYSNFRSVGSAPIKVQLDQHKTTLICGTNGAGKTTVLSALCFGLFGRGYGAISKPALINSINLKKMLVTVEFDIGKKKYKIVRGMKPNIFEIYEDTKLINQDPSVRDYQKILEQQLLKFNYRAFTQVVAVGGGNEYTPFMRLSTKDRREFVEDLLDIRVFSTMNNLVKDQIKASKEELKDISIMIKATKEKILLQESFIKKLKKERAASSDKILITIETLKDNNSTLSTQLDELRDQLEINELKVSKHNELNDALEGVRDTNEALISSLKKNTFTNLPIAGT